MKLVKSRVLIIIIYLLITLFFLRGIIFFPGKIIGGDWGLSNTFTQMERNFSIVFYSWEDKGLFGNEQFFLNSFYFQILTGWLSKIGITGEAYAKLLLILAFVFPALSMFLFCSFLGCSKKISLFGGLLYITLPLFFNYAAMGWLFVLFSMGILPLVLIFFIKSVKEEKIVYSVLTGVFYFLGMINPQCLIWYPFTFLCLAIYLIKDRKSLFLYLKSFLVIFLVFFALNTYLWLPLFFSGGSKLVSTKLGLSTVSLGTWTRLNYLNILRVWGSLFNYQYETAYPKFLTPLSFLLPIVAFLSLIFIKKRKLLLSFAVSSFITAILFTLGPKTIVKIPFSDIFRDIARSLVVPSFSYVVMATLFLDFLFKKRKKYVSLLGVILVILFVVNAYPFWAGELFGRQKEQHDIRLRTYNFPQGYFDLEEYLKSQKNDVKILYLPVGGSLNLRDDKRFYGPYKEIRDIFAGYSPKPGVIGLSDKGLGNATDFSLMLAKTIAENQLFSLDKLLSLMSVKYVAVRENAVFHPEELIKLLEGQAGLISEKKWDKVSLFRNSNFLPHFYIPQNIIYSPNNIEVLPEIVRLPEYELRSGIYLGSEINRNKAEIDGNMSPSETKYAVSPRNKEILEMADEVVAEAKLESQIDEEYFEKLETFKNGVPLPYVRWQPGSWEWKLARIKEKYEEWRVRKNPEKLIEKKLFFAGKRISELEKFADKADKKTLITLIGDGYQEKMNEVIEEIEKLRNLEINGWEEQVIKIRAYWEKHKEKINKLTNSRIKELKDWEKVFEELDEKIKRLEKKFDLENLEYRVDIPQKGNYSLFIKEINELTNLEIDGNKVEINGNKFGTNEKWTELGERELEEGKHKITLQLPESENLVGENWQKLQEEATESGEIKLVSQGFFPKGENVVFQTIRDWEGGKLYYLSFEYKTKGGNLGVSVLEDRLDINEINGLTDYKTKTEKILEKKLGNWETEKLRNWETEKLRNWEIGKLRNWETEKLGNWEKFERILRADENAQEAKIYFYTLPEPNAFAEVKFRNVKIYKIEQPKIVLRTVADNTGKKTRITPRITFVKINPTKYRIKVEGAKEPYTLVFSESFHSGWRLYVNIADNADRKADNAEIVASYFNGDIKEGTHRNTFLEKATFETWGKKPIAEDRHYLVNGYANSWYITPEDAGGKENYELIVEFWPQRLFYIGLGISLITLIGLLIVLIVKRG